MGDSKYKVESDFEDLHGNPAESVDVDVDFSDSDNPIIQAALGNEDYQPPEDDEDKDGAKNAETFVDDDEDDDDLEELSSDDEDAKSDDEDDKDEDDETDEDEDETYSSKVQKRIDRERDLRVSDKQEYDQRIAKLERTNKLFQAQSKFKDEKSEAEIKLKKLRKKKTEAIEAGETSEQVDIDDEILDIKADMKAKEMTINQLEESIDDVDESSVAGPPEAGRKFLSKYPQFHTNQQFKNTVLAADRMVMGRGFDKNLDAYYEEMEKILAPQFPEIVKLAKKTTKAEQRKNTAKKKRSAVGGVKKAGTGRTRQGVYRLTRADQEQMEIFGFDPKDATHIKNWVDSKSQGR